MYYLTRNYIIIIFRSTELDTRSIFEIHKEMYRIFNTLH